MAGWGVLLVDHDYARVTGHDVQGGGGVGDGQSVQRQCCKRDKVRYVRESEREGRGLHARSKAC
jgi:hypothetical protein